MPKQSHLKRSSGASPHDHSQLKPEIRKLVLLVCMFSFNVIWQKLATRISTLYNHYNNLWQEHNDQFNETVNELSLFHIPIAVQRASGDANNSLAAHATRAAYHEDQSVIFLNTKFGMDLLSNQVSSLLSRLLVEAPGEENQRLSKQILYCQEAFQKVIATAEWLRKNDNSLLAQSASRIKDFQVGIRQWNELKGNNRLKVDYQIAADIRLDVVIYKSPSTTLISDHSRKLEVLFKANLQLPVGKVYLIKGSSSKGKTTFLYSLARLWPFAEGTISLPCHPEEAYFVPQHLFTPRGKTLLEIIFYPHPPITPPLKREDVESIMRALGLANKIPLLNTRKEVWHLSGGERQKLALIGVILKKPKFVFMDELSAGIDKEGKKMTEILLKERLKGCTVFFTDHNPSAYFADVILEIENQELKISGGNIPTAKKRIGV